MARAYYNEIDPFAAQWLRNLIAAGHIAPGDVDERSIEDVKSADLIGYTQVHLFAGIGGWSLAARLAGWPDDKPLWTGSCPCQPFSAAGQRKGTADSRHLWPVFAALVRELRPPVVAGEQVASKDGLGWFDGVLADLEASRYAVWAADFCAAGVGAPHIRQRLWWLADADQGQRGPGRLPSRQAQGPQPEPSGRRFAGAWSSYDLLPCDDGSTRRAESGVFPLAHGVSGRMGRLRAYGNAIVPQIAAEILSAYLEGPDADV